MQKLLKQIIKVKEEEVRDIRRNFSPEVIKAAAFSVGSEFRSLEFSIKEAKNIPLLVEIKSFLFPERVALGNIQPLKIVRELIAAGLNAGIVIGTDRKYLGGDPGWLNLVKHNTELPIIQRDFFIDPAQVNQSKAIGADVILLHVDWTPANKLPEIASSAFEMGLECLVELEKKPCTLDLNPELFTGIIVNIPRRLQGTLDWSGISRFLKDSLSNKIKIARFYPRDVEEVAEVSRIGFQAILLNDEYWKTSSGFMDEYRKCRRWLEKTAHEK